MDEASQYRIPPGYRPNLDVRDLDGPYWTRDRIKASARFQYAVYQAARRLADDHGVRTVIDIGCGPAVKLNRLFGAPFELVGVDTADAVRVASELHRRGRYVVADLDDAALDLAALIPAVPGARLIICADVIEHLVHPERLLGAIRRYAAGDARIVLSTPDRLRLAGPAASRPSVPEHVREWSSSEFRRFLEESGFAVLAQHPLLPFRFGVDRMTAMYVVHQLRRRLPLDSNQIVVCRVAT